MKSLMAGCALLAAVSTSALAIDTTSAFQTLPPPTAPAHDWSGFYSNSSSWSVPYDTLIAGAPVASSAATTNSPLGGTQFGYNYQSGPFVFGIESDFARRYGMNSILLAPAGLDSVPLRDEQGWMGTVRPRAGIAADNWLFYATGGLAYGSFHNDQAFPGSGPVSDPGARAGWTVGGGLTYAGGKRWSLGLEYLYADFGKNLNENPLGPFSSSTAFRDQSHLLRGRFNYQFDWLPLPQK
jgi:outer membrane immunogenic protein